MVYVFLAEGFEEVEASSIIDMLRRGGADVRSVSVTGEKAVKGAHGIVFEADILFEEIDEAGCEMAVLPGGMPGTKNLQAHEGLCSLLKKLNDEGKWVCAICAAPMVLASLGILKGKIATIYPGMEEYLKDGGADPVAIPVVTDKNVMTSQGPGTAMLFGLGLLGLLKGEEEKEKVRDELYMAI